MKQKTVHVVSHSHWDREWYMPFEKHRMHLVRLIDDLLELFDTDPDFSGFFLDGQTIVLDDYLEIRPQNREKLIRHIQEGRLSAGPWYVLQDEFLVSGESTVRNLLVGMREAREYGRLSRIGYFPDAFGNAGQMPQLLRQAGIDVVFFGRGVKPIGANNFVEESGNYDSVFSEMQWQSPDGTSLFAVLFANWYNNGAEIPADAEEARRYWEERISKAERFASTDHLLFLNGCDHQPVQKDLSAALKTARALFPDTAFVHSSYEDYVKAVHGAQSRSLSKVEGELTSQETDGWWTLANTSSANIPLKQMNQKNQAALERLAEPLSVMACLLDQGEYPADLLRYAWKKLMQNHPHDSICGCSADAVNREIFARFEKSLALTEGIREEAVRRIAQRADTSAFGEESRPFVVINPSGWARNGLLSVELDVERDGVSGLTQAHDKMEAADPSGWCLEDSSGRRIPCLFEDLGVHFGYELPADRFRQPYMARAVRVTFADEEIPPVGCRTFALVRGENIAPTGSLFTGETRMENEVLAVSVQPDGTFDVTVKESGHTFQGLGAYEETGDVGNEYIYVRPANTEPITTRGALARIVVEEDTPLLACFRIEHTLRIPESADDTLRQEQERMITINQRKAGRSEKLVEFKIVTLLSLEKGGRGLRIQVRYQNTAKDHRLRMLFPTGLDAKTHRADSVFEAVRRPNRPSAAWKNPENCQHQQCWVSLDDGENGLAVANLGLNEYEVLEDNSIAVTLLRSVGEIGDWGVFPTPGAQCLGEGEAQLELIPHKGDLLASGAFRQAYQFQAEPCAVQTTPHPGEKAGAFLAWEGETLALSCLKEKEDGKDIIVRWFNLAEKPCTLTVTPVFAAKGAYRCGVTEEEGEALVQNSAGGYTLEAGPAEIVTIGFKR